MTDPTNAERQRRFRARRKAAAEGKLEVRIETRVYWIPSATARRIERQVSKAERLSDESATSRGEHFDPNQSQKGSVSD